MRRGFVSPTVISLAVGCLLYMGYKEHLFEQFVPGQVVSCPNRHKYGASRNLHHCNGNVHSIKFVFKCQNIIKAEDSKMKYLD